MFPEHVDAWLEELEKVFTSIRLYQVAAIAGIRSELIAASQGQVPPGVTFKGLPSRSRVKSAAAAQALRQASDVASSIVRENRGRFAEAEGIAQQLIAIALPRGLVHLWDPDLTNTEYLLQLRDRLGASDLQPALLHLEALVGPNDTLILLDRALALRSADIVDIPQRGAGARGHPPRPPEEGRSAPLPLLHRNP